MKKCLWNFHIFPLLHPKKVNTAINIRFNSINNFTSGALEPTFLAYYCKYLLQLFVEFNCVQNLVNVLANIAYSNLDAQRACQVLNKDA